MEQFKEKFFAPVAGVKVDKNSGEMKLAWEILLPPIDLDLADAGKQDSQGWVFFSSYNTEMAYGNLEVNASQNDRDFLVALNGKAAEDAASANNGTPPDAPGPRPDQPEPATSHCWSAARVFLRSRQPPERRWYRQVQPAHRRAAAGRVLALA